VTATTASPLVVLDGVGRTFPGETPVVALADVDLVVAPQEYVSIVGPSGSGKSTLLNVLGLLDRPTAGRYVLDGVDTGELDEADRSALRGRRIGFVFQAFHLIAHRTVEENVTLGALYLGVARKERRRRAIELLERVGLGHRMGFLPTRLSGGERQRAAIARALAGDPRLLLCDEPTGNLDTATTESILALFEELRGDGLSLVVITHDLEVAAHGDRTVRVVDGRVVDGRAVDGRVVDGRAVVSPVRA
jgi:putative ABC transport system ATP-binding protein